MYVKEFNKILSDIDRDILLYIQNRMLEAKQQLKNHVLTICKYKIGSRFNHERYGLIEIIDIEVRLNRDDTLSDFNSYMMPLYGIDYYKPYYIYVVNCNGDMLTLIEKDLNEAQLVK